MLKIVGGKHRGRALMAPDALTAETAAARIVELSMGRPITLVGSGSPLVEGLVVSATAVAGIASITANAAAYTRRDVRILDLGLTWRTSYVLSTGRLRG